MSIPGLAKDLQDTVSLIKGMRRMTLGALAMGSQQSPPGSIRSRLLIPGCSPIKLCKGW